MKIPIQDWIDENGDDAAVEQACRFRDMFAQCIATSYEEFKDCVKVVGEHTSKSIRLPVVRLQANGLTVVMRDNFHNVAVSVVGMKSPLRHQMQTFLKRLCVAGYNDAVLIAEGFPADMRLGSYRQDFRSFTVQVARWYDAYALLSAIGALQAGRDALPV